MATILIVGEDQSTRFWTDELTAAGHAVEAYGGSLDFQERFAGEAVDIFIVDIAHADWGEAMLIPQARAAWPACRTIAVASSYAFRSSAVYQMGLWSPDQLLLKPVGAKVLCATVSFLWAQIRTEQIKQHLTKSARHQFFVDRLGPHVSTVSTSET